MQCSSLVFDLILADANCVRFWQNTFCCEVHEACLPHDKEDSDKTVHNLQLTSAWIRVERPAWNTRFSFIH